LWIFLILFMLSLGAEFIANEKPLLIRYDGQWYVPIFQVYPETTFGGDFPVEAYYRDAYIQEQIAAKGWMLWPPIAYSHQTVNFQLNAPAPAPPSLENWLGTDDQGRDVLARVIYGFRISVLFGLMLTLSSSVIGIAAGAVQGYFGGWTDLLFQRFMEIWSGLPGVDQPNLAAVHYPAVREACMAPETLHDMGLIQELVVSVRNIRSELGIGPAQRLEVLVCAGTARDRDMLEANHSTISHLARLESLRIAPSLTPPKAAASAVVQGLEVFVPLAGAVDFQTELDRLDKELAKAAKELAIVNRKVANEDFMAKAPADVVAKERAKASDITEKQAKLAALRQRLLSLME